MAHMLTDAGCPPPSVENLKIDTFWDGLFHATTYVFVVMGLVVLWRESRRRHVRWWTKLPAGTLLIGLGLFNLVDGIVDHHLLGIHRVNETVPREQWIFGNLGFLALGCRSRWRPPTRSLGTCNNLLAIRLRNSSSGRWTSRTGAPHQENARPLLHLIY